MPALRRHRAALGPTAEFCIIDIAMSDFFMMHRAQISLQEGQYRALAIASRREGISLAELIRRLADDYLRGQQSADSALERLVGFAEGTGESVGRDHDRFLYGKEQATRLDDKK